MSRIKSHALPLHCINRGKEVVYVYSVEGTRFHQLISLKSVSLVTFFLQCVPVAARCKHSKGFLLSAFPLSSLPSSLFFLTREADEMKEKISFLLSEGLTSTVLVDLGQ